MEKLMMGVHYCDSEKELNEFLSTLSVEEGKYPKLANIQYLVNPTAEGNDTNFKLQNSIIAIVNYFVKVQDYDED